MKGYVIRATCSVISLWLIVTVVPEFGIEGAGAWLICVLAIGLSNGLARTAIVFYVLPLRLGTVAALSVAMNAVLLALLAVLVDGVAIEGAVAAVIGWFAMAGLASAATLYIGPDGRIYPLIPESRQSAAR
ncbi:MAG: phage holin family protein [Rhodospirillaceae bacterium]|nr:phage holin family protein [Rhodospirillaceae bacterium]MDE0362419.1 phage holin family protein [Rhodospirillaceae bacterium]